nr:basic helix-loop-helix family protein [Rosa persica]
MAEQEEVVSGGRSIARELVFSPSVSTFETPNTGVETHGLRALDPVEGSNSSPIRDLLALVSEIKAMHAEIAAFREQSWIDWVDISTMLEEAVNYVKFLQLQIKDLAHLGRRFGSNSKHWFASAVTAIADLTQYLPSSLGSIIRNITSKNACTLRETSPVNRHMESDVELGEENEDNKQNNSLEHSSSTNLVYFNE